MPKFHKIKVGKRFRYAAEHRKDTVYVKENLTKGVVAANAREVESGDTAYISLKAEVEKIPETEQ